MSNIWIISDTHWNHNKEFIWKDRGYNSIEEMNKDLIDKWNSVVAPEDIVYHLGDVIMGDLYEGIKCFSQVNGKIHIIRGNHDTPKRVEMFLAFPNVLDVKYADIIKFRKKYLYLSHYPTIVANHNGDTAFYAINGHTHDKEIFNFPNYRIYNACVDAHNGFPVNLEKIKTDIMKRIYSE